MAQNAELRVHLELTERGREYAAGGIGAGAPGTA
jgi:hypothetical protein